jgi:hypothetical protein
VAAAKLQNTDEFTRWWNEGKTYDWIVAEYERKYHLVITPSAIGNWRSRLGLPRRQQRNVNLVPWAVKREHRYRHALAMLRAEGRRRSGEVLPDLAAERLARWTAFLAETNAVVHYDPDTEDGFFYVPRRPEVDTDLVREPERNSRERGIRE